MHFFSGKLVVDIWRVTGQHRIWKPSDAMPVLTLEILRKWLNTEPGVWSLGSNLNEIQWLVLAKKTDQDFNRLAELKLGIRVHGDAIVGPREAFAGVDSKAVIPWKNPSGEEDAEMDANEATDEKSSRKRKRDDRRDKEEKDEEEEEDEHSSKRSRSEPSSSSSSSTSRSSEDQRMAARFAHLSGSLVNGLTRPGKYDTLAKTVLGVFQIDKPNEDPVDRLTREQYMQAGKDEEARTLDMAAQQYGYVYTQKEQEFIEDERFPWLGATADQRTKTLAIEAKFKAKDRDKPVRVFYGKGGNQPTVPPWRIDQMMLEKRVTKATEGADLLERSDVNMVRYLLRPDPAAEEYYWKERLVTYCQFYRDYLAWYWQRDLRLSGKFVKLMGELHVPWTVTAALLQRAIEDDHEVLQGPNGTRVLDKS
jgi:hypothetical protein